MAQLLEKPQQVATDHYLLKIECDTTESFPGQFINIKADQGNDPLLRRPFSIYNHYDNIIEVIIKVIGKGTVLLRNKRPGPIDILGPLGRGFTLCENKQILLAGGGVGNAPMYYLAKKLKENKNNVHMIYGARSQEYIYMLNEFRKICDNVIVCTDDGSMGSKQFVHEVIRCLPENIHYDYVYTCGPTIMMQHVVKTVPENIPVEISVENYFGCGIGLCVGCTVHTTQGQKRACVDGPIFNGREIIWSSIED